MDRSLSPQGWIIRVLLAIGLSVVAIAAAPAVMEPAYLELQPRLGAMTLFLVEVIYALFIDLPLTTLFVALCALFAGPVANPARLALTFLGTFFALILATIGLAPSSELLSHWALADTFPFAIAQARSALGDATAALMIGLFVAFDAALCAAGGIVGHQLVQSRVTAS